MKNESNDQTQYQKINKRKRVPIYFKDPSLAQQNLKEETDINHIIKKYKETGELPVQKRGFYGDVTQIPDYQEALNTIKNAKDLFDSLPSNIRSEFANDPGTMLTWIQNPENSARAIELGLIEGDTSKNQPEPPEQEKQKETLKS